MIEKAISIKQPWAYLICAGIKDVENRTWATRYRGRVYIHASMDKRINLSVLTKQQYEDVCDKSDWNTTTVKPVDRWDRGAIIGHVDIVNCISKERNGKGSCSIWAEPDCFHWILRNPVLFDKPVLNVKGNLGFWDCSDIIHSDIDEDGKSVCMCNLGIDEKDQVLNMIDRFECKYCGGKWYK